MLRFNANLTTMYAKLPLLDAMSTARADGFDAVECRTPFDEPKQKVADHAADLNLTFVQFNTPMGDFAAGERGMACLPDRKADFRSSIELTLDYAQALGCPQINCPAGKMPTNVSYESAESTLAKNLKWAADRLGSVGIKLQLEAINPTDNSGAFVWNIGQCERMLELVDHPNLFLQYDFYHMQMVQGDLMRTYDRLKDRINHIQVADNPGRNEPGTGEINYDFIFAELERLKYGGWVGCEYVPVANANQGLGWLEKYSPRHV